MIVVLESEGYSEDNNTIINIVDYPQPLDKSVQWVGQRFIYIYFKHGKIKPHVFKMKTLTLTITTILVVILIIARLEMTILLLL